MADEHGSSCKSGLTWGTIPAGIVLAILGAAIFSYVLPTVEGDIDNNTEKIDLLVGDVNGLRVDIVETRAEIKEDIADVKQDIAILVNALCKKSDEC